MSRLMLVAVVVLAGCVTAPLSSSSSPVASVLGPPPMKTTCARAAQVFEDDRLTALQRQEAARELQGRQFQWRLRVVEVEDGSPLSDGEGSLVLLAECADYSSALPGRPAYPLQKYALRLVCPRSLASQLAALSKGSTVTAIGLFRGISPSQVTWMTGKVIALQND